MELSGVVKFFNEQKGFGFISSEGKDVFVHLSGLKDPIKEGDNVTFEMIDSDKGPKANNVRVV